MDFLLSDRQILRRKEDGKLVLCPEVAKKLEQTERLYLSDWRSLTGAQTALLTEYGGAWTEQQAELATISLTRLFLLEQLKGLKFAGAELLTGAWMGRMGDPRQRLRDLLQQCGVPIPRLAEVIGKLVELARNREVVAKLTRTAVFAALDPQQV